VSPAFIEERRVLLENYLLRLIKTSVSKSKLLLTFCTSNKIEKVPEQKKASKSDAIPDDVEVTDISIPATRTMSDHVLYQVDVCNRKKRKSFSKWTVLKRFGQFYEMDQAVRLALADKADVLASMPSSPQRKVKLFNDHMEQNFIEERRALLENYLQKMRQVPEVLRCAAFLTFLGVNV